MAPHSLKSIDHHWKDRQFATAGEALCLWDANRPSSDPMHTYRWGADSIRCCRFNPAEACLLASTASDRSVCLYDLRASVPMRKFVLSMKSNNLAWNPMEPFNFTIANEDHNLYTFDMRNLSKALMIHKDHVGAVMDVAYSPTGNRIC
jgi:WD repeat and SOF domain-containing protein 1